MEKEMAQFHKHLIVNAIVNNPIQTEEECNCWLAELVRVIDMDILIPPHSKYCDIEGNEGVTGTCVITTSHVSIHVWSKVEKPYIRMDVYSCKDFAVEEVLEYVDRTMGTVEEGHIVVDRNEMKPKLKCCAGRNSCQEAKV
jgi:S-adenosylmethionine/arginine decarboxylase-like enzyme